MGPGIGTGAAMADRLDILRRAVLGAQGYIAIMAAGMFTTGHVFGYEYGTMVLVLAPFEVVLSLYAIVMARRLLGGWDCGFLPLDTRGLAWMVPSFAVIAALFAASSPPARSPSRWWRWYSSPPTC